MAHRYAATPNRARVGRCSRSLMASVAFIKTVLFGKSSRNARGDSAQAEDCQTVAMDHCVDLLGIELGKARALDHVIEHVQAID